MDKNKILRILPLVFLLAITPLIVYLKVCDTPYGSLAYFAWPLGEKNYDFFSYYKAMAINISALLMLVVILIKRDIKRTYIYIFLGRVPTVCDTVNYIFTFFRGGDSRG